MMNHNTDDAIDKKGKETFILDLTVSNLIQVMNKHRGKYISIIRQDTILYKTGLDSQSWESMDYWG